MPSTQDESSRLIFDDPNGHNYGSFGDQHVGVAQADPLEVQRETEALQKVVAQTSKYVLWTVGAGATGMEFLIAVSLIPPPSYRYAHTNLIFLVTLLIYLPWCHRMAPQPRLLAFLRKTPKYYDTRTFLQRCQLKTNRAGPDSRPQTTHPLFLMAGYRKKRIWRK